MDSWFGGPSTSSRKEDRDSKYYVRDSHSHSQSHRDSRPHRDSTTHRPRSPSPKKYFVRPHSPSAKSTASTSRGFFSRPSAGAAYSSSSSYYKRRPRDGYISRLVYQIKRYIRKLMDYAKRNPMKLFMLVIVPLVTGGALKGVLTGLGIKLPASVAGLMGGSHAGREGFGGGYGGRESAGGGSGIDLGQVVSVAKMFM